MKDIVVIDNGTDTVKIGLSGEDYPRIIIDSITGSQNIKSDSEGLNNKPQHLFGNSLKQAVADKKHEIQYNYPIKRGVNIIKYNNYILHTFRKSKILK